MKDKTLLITGGCGSFGRAFTQKALTLEPKVIRILCHSEKSKGEAYLNDPRLRYPMGDVRDRDKMFEVMEGVDYVIHAAALKEVDNGEYCPEEFDKTNIVGSRNVKDAALHWHVEKFVALSTDKAVEAINHYGHTKAIMETEVIAANKMNRPTKLACTRYGNVIGSRGSVIPKWREQSKTGVIDITDPDMTRFWITMDLGIELVLDALKYMQGGEIFIPKIPSMRLTDLAKVVAPGSEYNVIGLRPGEKLHEVLLSRNESHKARELARAYVIKEGIRSNLPKGFQYSSDQNTQWVTESEMRGLL